MAKERSKRVNIDKERMREELKRISEALGITSNGISLALTGSYSSLSSGISQGKVSEDVLDKMAAMYGLRKDYVVITEPQVTEAEQSQPSAEPKADHTELIKAITALTAEVKLLRNEMTGIKGDVEDIKADLVRRPFPILPVELKGILSEQDHSGEIYRALKLMRDPMIETIAWGISRADKDKEKKK